MYKKKRIAHIYHIQTSTTRSVNVTKREYKDIVDSQHVVYRAKLLHQEH